MHNREPGDLFARLPGHFRIRDADQGRPLEALMGIFREELGILEQDLDQLYDNWFVETCEPWVLPYIAALIGAQSMRDIDEDQAGFLRAYVANVLQFRQAKGTAAVIEQVARDVSGWPVVAVEFFQRLAMSQNVKHVRPQALAFPDLRDSTAARHSRSPFSTMAHGAAVGAPEDWAGRYNIPHLGIFVWRQTAAPLWPVESGDGAYLGGATPWRNPAEPGLLRFDPLGRDMPLVNRPDADPSVAARVTERMLPAALQRGELYEALNAARTEGATTGLWFEKSPPFRVRLNGAELPPQKLYCCDLSKSGAGVYRRPPQAGEVMVDPKLGRLSLHPDDEALTLEAGFAQAASFDIGGGAYDRRESLERWLPDFLRDGEAEPWQIGVTRIAEEVTDDPLLGGPVVSNLREAIRRWNEFSGSTSGARGIISVMDNATYDEALNAARRIVLPPGSKLAIVAAAWPASDTGSGTKLRKPGRVTPLHRRPTLNGPVMVEGLEAGEDDGAVLVIDGLVIGQRLRLRDGGDLAQLSLYNCTISAEQGLLSQPLLCTSDNARVSVTLHRCILGEVNLPTATGRLEISRSIIGEDRTVDGGVPATQVIRAPKMDVGISGSTLFGRVTCRSIDAENAILLGHVELEHRQSGCVRFCYATRDSALPRRYSCVPRESDPQSLRPLFTSTRFEDPGFAQLSRSTASDILEGAEGGMEMGAGYANRDPARHANMLDAIREFAPFGLSPGIIFMT